ncbi:uncharacterized protein si:dkey-58f10.13 [Danio aesculapii]|uniref:uncharacterized protein si:dkey-58f10.13 n=1 Tax=Danio aesculapii TaxID=1142201 RepID=UPI0024BFFD61|nr:uncharacterized protein si:dkey-58f10.13 [Danio aesculapii]XP_056314281.1 uncharacterized protein si:dkey-58f10.13 [Danio aesculapii]XP_056314282.1 uncharacterized protein si:dkey-58f10.13 [Danio aesculapii]
MDRLTDDFHKKLRKEVSGLRVTSIVYCDFILYFCLIASRAGTDIDAAIRNLKDVAAGKQVIMVVLHLTIDPEKTITDTNSARNDKNIYYVDFLFNEDEGLMNCQKNKDAIKKLVMYMKSRNLTSYYLQNYGSSRTNSYQDGEDIPLNPEAQQDGSGGIVDHIKKHPVAFGGVVVIFGTIVGVILYRKIWGAKTTLRELIQNFQKCWHIGPHIDRSHIYRCFDN